MSSPDESIGPSEEGEAGPAPEAREVKAARDFAESGQVEATPHDAKPPGDGKSAEETTESRPRDGVAERPDAGSAG